MISNPIFQMKSLYESLSEETKIAELHVFP